MAPAKGGLSWWFAHLAGWGTTPFYHLAMREFLDEQLPTNWPPRFPDLSPLLLLGFHQRLCLHTTIITVLCTALMPNIRRNCPSWCNIATAHLAVPFRHMLHNSWCTQWTLIGKTWNLSLYFTKSFHCCNCVT